MVFIIELNLSNLKMKIRKICRPSKYITTTCNSLMLHSNTYLQFEGLYLSLNYKKSLVLVFLQLYQAPTLTTFSR